MGKQEIKFSRISLGETDRKLIQNFIISNKEKDIKMSYHRAYIAEGVGLSICNRGKGKLKINLKEYEINSNTIIFILPGEIIELIDKSDDLEIESLFFPFDFIFDLKPTFDINIFKKLTQTPCITINKKEANNLKNFYNFIIEKYQHTNHIYRDAIIKNLLHSFIMEIAAIYHKNKGDEKIISNRKEELFNKFLQLLYKYHKRERSITFYADKMFLTPKYLSTVIKDISGSPMLDWINKMVIFTAKGLLRSSNLTVSQISEELNFPNASFFGCFFKKHVGITPMKYRSSLIYKSS